MASSSTSSDETFSTSSNNQKSFKYHVFLSFRGEDTRKGFVDHLYAALTQQGIHTFRDNEELEKGKRIDELFKAIEMSRFFIIVFSKDYASSSWCLKELAKIMECHDEKEQIAHPLFYDVEPSDIRNRSGPVGRAIAKHKTTKKQIKKWEKALESAGNLVGWDLKNIANGHENEVIQKIVKEISGKLRPIYLRDDENLIGMDRRMQELESSLGIGLNDKARMIGIKGMGGIGKTTLANAIFVKYFSHFEGSSFVADVRELSKKDGLRSLQEQVLSEVLNVKHMHVGSVYDGKNKMRMRLPNKKVLLVLDDVDDSEQLKALAGDWFKNGSRIIITTRDEKVLRSHGVDVNWIHDASLLSDEEAMSLFSRHAFKRYVPDEGFEKLSSEVVRYAAGLPLTIEVLGSHLHGENKAFWIDAIRRLQTIPLRETLEVLEISYINLEYDLKEMFLDVAYFLKGYSEAYAIRILESLGFRATYGLKTLEKKSLITIRNDIVSMHDSLAELGRNIVRRSHPDEPNKHSRLWDPWEIVKLFSDDAGTEASSCIGLMMLVMKESEEVSAENIIKRLGNMNKLRYLYLFGRLDDLFAGERNFDEPDDSFPSDWKFDQEKHYFPNSLRYLRWSRYPFPALPQTFRADNLVGLELLNSGIVKLWESGERKVFRKLRFLDLGNSKLRSLDLETTPDLERLDLQGCHDLTEIHAPAGCLESLVFVDLRGCSWSVTFPLAKQLESLVLCSLPELLVCVECLEEQTTNLPMLRFQCNYMINGKTSSIENDPKAVRLDLEPCTKIESVSGSIFGFQHLTHLLFTGCIPELPSDLDQMKCLGRITLLSTHIKCLPDNVCLLKHLNYLQITNCGLLEKLPEDIGQLECLEHLLLEECESLRDIPDSICNLKRLVEFRIKSTGITHLPHSISSLNGLTVFGSPSILQSCATFATTFATGIETSILGPFCVIQGVNSTPAPTELRSQSTEKYLKRLYAFKESAESVEDYMLNVEPTRGSGSTRSSRTFRLRSKIHRLMSHF